VSGDPFNFIILTLDRVAVALVCGVAITWIWRLPHPVDAATTTIRTTLRILGLVIPVLALTGIATLWMRSATMAEVDLTNALPVVPRVIGHSQFGHLWLVRVIGWSMLAAAGVWMRWRRTAGSWLLACGAILIIFSLSASGHAGDDGVWTTRAFINALHVTGGCAWGGTVAVYAAAVLPGLVAGVRRPAIGRMAIQLSTIAAAALAVVLVTGVYNAWQQIDTPTALWTTVYGRVLLVKLTFVAVMMAIGAANRFFIVPEIVAWANTTPSVDRRVDTTSAGNPVRRFLWILRLDSLVFLIVLACAVILAGQMPASHGDHSQAPDYSATAA
jgi:putative copper resistance protein D